MPCAAEQLSSIQDPCPICAQERRNGRCHNRLCTRPASSRHFEGITAITLHNDPLVDVMQRFKYRGKSGWGMIFARLLIGHLYETWDPGDVDLIIANPPSPGRNHTTLVVGYAATYDTADDWPFDDTDDPAIIKTIDTTRSAGKDLPGKQSAALEHGNALVLRHPDRIERQPRHRLRRHLHHRGSSSTRWLDTYANGAPSGYMVSCSPASPGAKAAARN